MHHYRSVHALRAIAALLVAWFHIHAWTPELVSASADFAWMSKSVDIFFVISGFVMVKSTENKTIGTAEFISLRLKRIVPVYWVCTLFLALSGQYSFGFVASSLLFAPYYSEQTQTYLTMIPQAWTLCYEMMFYVLFAVSLSFPKNARLWLMIVALAGLVGVSQFVQSGSILAYYGNPIILDFLAGMAIAHFGWRLPAIMAPVAFAVLAFAVPSGVGGGIMLVALPSAVILAAGLSFESRMRAWPGLSLMGDASYAIYLVHFITIAVLRPLITPTAIGQWAYALVQLAAAVIVGIAIHIWIERPVAAYFKRARRTTDPVLAAPALVKEALVKE